MRAGLACLGLVGLMALAACGGGGQEEAAPAETVAESAPQTPAETSSEPAPELQEDGSVRTFAEAGFTAYWPPGCGRLREQISSGRTRQAQQEFIYTCDRDGAMTTGVSVRAYRAAHGPNDTAPDAALVTELVKRQLQRSGTGILRQRPLKAAGIEGVEVHAAEPDGAAEVWIRGLLSGTDIYMILAWDKSGGLFENPEIVDFFASFRLTDQ